MTPGSFSRSVPARSTPSSLCFPRPEGGTRRVPAGHAGSGVKGGNDGRPTCGALLVRGLPASRLCDDGDRDGQREGHDAEDSGGDVTSRRGEARLLSARGSVLRLRLRLRLCLGRRRSGGRGCRADRVRERGRRLPDRGLEDLHAGGAVARSPRRGNGCGRRGRGRLGAGRRGRRFGSGRCGLGRGGGRGRSYLGLHHGRRIRRCRDLRRRRGRRGGRRVARWVTRWVTRGSHGRLRRAGIRHRGSRRGRRRSRGDARWSDGFRRRRRRGFRGRDDQTGQPGTDGGGGCRTREQEPAAQGQCTEGGGEAHGGVFSEGAASGCGDDETASRSMLTITLHPTGRVCSTPRVAARVGRLPGGAGPG